MTARGEHKQRTHERILDSAARLLRNRGIAGARVADVMQGAALTVGGFYAHFGSKEALVDEALRRTATALRGQLFAGLDAKPREERAVRVLERYLSRAHRDDVRLGCPFPAVVGEIGTTAPAHRAVLAEQLDALGTALAQHLPDARTSTRRTLALGLVALMYGGLSLARAVRGTPLSDEILHACRAVGAAVVRSDLS